MRARLGAVDLSAWATERMIEKIDNVYAWLARERREAIVRKISP
jgi:hypothetical protein